MNAVAQVAAVATGLSLVVVFVMESFFFRSPALHRFFLIEPGEEQAVRLWAVNQGFYNLYFGVAAIAGVVLVHLGEAAVGTALVLFTMASMFLAGLVLYVTEPRLWLSTIWSCLPPGVALVALAVAG